MAKSWQAWVLIHCSDVYGVKTQSKFRLELINLEIILNRTQICQPNSSNLPYETKELKARTNSNPMCLNKKINAYKNQLYKPIYRAITANENKIKYIKQSDWGYIPKSR